MRTLTITLSLTLGGAIALCSGAWAEEARMDMIFTGVVPSTCALSMPSSTPTSTSSNQSSDATEAAAVQVICNDAAQIDSRAYEVHGDRLQAEDTAPATSQQDGYLTITLP